MLRPDPAALVDQLCELGETDFWIKSVDAARGHVDIVLEDGGDRFAIGR
jgi:hypothetical protein